MRLALLCAKRAQKKEEVPIGAVIVDGSGKVLSRAFNRREGKNDATWHAETAAIRKACKKVKDFRLVDCSIFVTLEPCPMCAGAIVNARISNVFFGAKSVRNESDVLDKIFNSKVLNHKCCIEGGVLENECSELLKKFFSERRTVKNAGE